MMPINLTMHIGSFANCTALRLQHGDDAGLADALPGQAQHEGIKLGMRQRERAGNISWPHEPALVQAPRSQPYANTIVHEHLHPVGPPVGEQVRMVRPG